MLESEVLKQFLTELLIILSALVFIFYCILLEFNPIKWFFYLIFPKKKREKKQKEEQEKKDWEEKNKNRAVEVEKQRIFNDLKYKVLEYFSVELEKIDQTGTQDEIVRVVNLLATEIAIACVNSDKAARGETVKPYYDPSKDKHFQDFIPWAEVVMKKKILWAKSRNVAILAMHELESRMPHFSEYEPLKTYRQKKSHLEELPCA
jgi:hypothetical protein